MSDRGGGHKSPSDGMRTRIASMFNKGRGGKEQSSTNQKSLLDDQDAVMERVTPRRGKQKCQDSKLNVNNRRSSTLRNPSNDSHACDPPKTLTSSSRLYLSASSLDQTGDFFDRAIDEGVGGGNTPGHSSSDEHEFDLKTDNWYDGKASIAPSRRYRPLPHNRPERAAATLHGSKTSLSGKNNRKQDSEGEVTWSNWAYKVINIDGESTKPTHRFQEKEYQNVNKWDEDNLINEDPRRGRTDSVASARAKSGEAPVVRGRSGSVASTKLKLEALGPAQGTLGADKAVSQSATDLPSRQRSTTGTIRQDGDPSYAEMAGSTSRTRLASLKAPLRAASGELIKTTPPPVRSMLPISDRPPIQEIRSCLAMKPGRPRPGRKGGQSAAAVISTLDKDLISFVDNRDKSVSFASLHSHSPTPKMNRSARRKTDRVDHQSREFYTKEEMPAPTVERIKTWEERRAILRRWCEEKVPLPHLTKGRGKVGPRMDDPHGAIAERDGNTGNKRWEKSLNGRSRYAMSPTRGNVSRSQRFSDYLFSGADRRRKRSKSVGSYPAKYHFHDAGTRSRTRSRARSVSRSSSREKTSVKTVLLASNLRGEMSRLKDIAKQESHLGNDLVGIAHVGEFGFWSAQPDANGQVLEEVVAASPLLDPISKATLQRIVEEGAKFPRDSHALSQLPSYVTGQQRLPCKVFAIPGKLEEDRYIQALKKGLRLPDFCMPTSTVVGNVRFVGLWGSLEMALGIKRNSERQRRDSLTKRAPDGRYLPCLLTMCQTLNSLMGRKPAGEVRILMVNAPSRLDSREMMGMSYFIYQIALATRADLIATTQPDHCEPLSQTMVYNAYAHSMASGSAEFFKGFSRADTMIEDQLPILRRDYLGRTPSDQRKQHWKIIDTTLKRIMGVIYTGDGKFPDTVVLGNVKDGHVAAVEIDERGGYRIALR